MRNGGLFQYRARSETSFNRKSFLNNSTFQLEVAFSLIEKSAVLVNRNAGEICDRLMENTINETILKFYVKDCFKLYKIKVIWKNAIPR